MAKCLQYKTVENSQQHSAQLGAERTPWGLSINRNRSAKLYTTERKKIHKIDVILCALHLNTSILYLGVGSWNPEYIYTVPWNRILDP